MAKKPISATIDEELISWLDKEIQNNKKYRNKSHLIETALQNLRDEEKTNASEKRRKN